MGKALPNLNHSSPTHLHYQHKQELPPLSSPRPTNTMDKVIKSLKDLERKTTKTSKIVSKGSHMTLGDAIKLGRKSNSIVSTIKKGIKEYDGFEPTNAEAKKVYDQMVTIVNLTESQLKLLVENKATFDKLRVGGLVKKNIIKTEEASSDLAKLLVSKAPPELKAGADVLEKRASASFVAAIRAFKDVSGGEDKEAELGEDDSD